MKNIKNHNMKLIIKNLRYKLLSSFGYFWNLIISDTLINVIYIVEKQNWSIYCDGFEITRQINKKIRPNFCRISNRPYIYQNKIIHFGSQYMWTDWYKYLPKNNKYVVNFYHGKNEDGNDVKEHIYEFIKSVVYVDIILTASSLIMKRLIKWGVPKNKIVLIPIGVNTNIFCPASKNERNKIRKMLGLSPSEFLIGSFQKDGVGWKEGLRPKLIKGPDIFIEVLKIIRKKIKINVLLTGPARGYIKHKLQLNNIPYSHFYLNLQQNISKFYQVLDLYLVTSREEGGPKAIVEGLSSGIPVASTDVGMARDFIKNNKNGILLNSFEPELIANQILSFLDMKENLNVDEMRKSVYNADWKIVAEQHFSKIYKPLLNINK